LTRFRDFHPPITFFKSGDGGKPMRSIPRGKDNDYSFDTLWDNAGRVTNDGYVFFFRFVQEPAVLACPEATWGIALYRTILRKSDTIIGRT